MSYFLFLNPVQGTTLHLEILIFYLLFFFKFFYLFVSLKVEAHRLSCWEACGILVPQRGFEPASPELQGRFLTPGPPGKSWQPVFFKCVFLAEERVTVLH